MIRIWEQICIYSMHKNEKNEISMRATIEIDERLLQEAIAATGMKKKRQLIELALQEILRQRRIERLRQRLGKTPLTLTVEDLRRLRADD